MKHPLVKKRLEFFQAQAGNDNIDIDYGDKKEKGAFYAINSWGVSNTSFNKIYIPYSYGDILDTVCGYICTDTDSSDTSSNSIELVSSTAGTKVGDEIGFTKKFMSRGINPNNLFVYGEEIELSYHVTGDFEFTNTFVKIYQGQTDVTSSFSVSFYDDERNVVISSDDESKLGECYNIEFYNENHYIGTEEIFIFTGTEVSYIEFSEESDKKIVDSTLFNNNFALMIFFLTH